MYNKVILIGNLGADPELRTLDSGSRVVKISVATNENYQDKAGEWQKRTEWHTVIGWNNLADRMSNSLKKGMMVFIEGKVTYRKWQDQEGKDRYTTDILANTMRLLEKREPSNGGGGFPSDADAQAYVKQAPVSNPASPQAEAPQVNTPEEDDLPF
jgi:single-strand DNA-binding protein